MPITSNIRRLVGEAFRLPPYKRLLVTMVVATDKRADNIRPYAIINRLRVGEAFRLPPYKRLLVTMVVTADKRAATDRPYAIINRL